MNEQAIINCLSIKIFKADKLKHFLLLGRSWPASLYPIDKKSAVLLIKNILKSARLADQASLFMPIAFKSADIANRLSSIAALALELAELMPSEPVFLTTGLGSLELSFQFGDLDLLFTLSYNPFASIFPTITF